ncbi:MAG: hypothetical protein WAX85_03075 [Minisyncoccia bacterium]
MSDRQNVHLLYKKLGETPNECILRWKKENPKYFDAPMTYAGRLDPMAEGLLLILSGEELKNKDKYLDLKKTYEFEILWGFTTDTLDVLGLVLDSSDIFPPESEIKNYLKKMTGKFEQIYPIYSSKPVNGKPLFQWAREGRINEVEMPKHKVEIFNIEHISRREISKKNLLENIFLKISSVSGDFRQNETIEKWEEVISKCPLDTFLIDKFYVKVSSGFYVRQFVLDLAKSFNTKAVTFHIKRIKVGDYGVEQSLV